MKKIMLTLMFVSISAVVSSAENSTLDISVSERDCTKFSIGVYNAWIDGGSMSGMAMEMASSNYRDCVNEGGIPNENGWEGVAEQLSIQ